MTVDITGIDPDPAWMDTPVTVQATAAFSADGREQEQAVLGWIPEFRWKWEFLSDGTVTSSDPALDPQQSGWSIWSPLNSASGTGTFPTGLVKQAKVTVQVRMVPTAGAPSAPVCQGVATEALDVWELKDVTNLHVVRFEQNSVTLAWDPADCPGVAGYMYHIEPDRATLTDVGTSTQVTIPNMTVGQTYTVGVHTYDALGHMTHTAYVTFTVASSPPPVPVVYVFPAPSGTAVDVLWAPVEAPNMDRYDVKIGSAALASAPHITSKKFYLTTVNLLTEGQPIDLTVCAVNTADGTSTKAAPEVTPVPFHEMHATQKGTEEKRLALGKFNGATNWTAALNAVSARDQLRGVLTGLSNASYMCPIPAPGLSFFKGYDDYGHGGHFLDTTWLPVKIPTGDSWLAVPSHYVNTSQWSEILTQFARVLLWIPADWNQHVSSVTGTRSIVSCGGAFDAASWAGAVAMLPAIYDMNKSSFPEFEPPTEFGFWGWGYNDPTLDWPWLIPWAMRMTGSIVLTFASDNTVDWFHWTDDGSSVAPGGFCTVNYPEGYFPTAGTPWKAPPANGDSVGYGDYGRVCYNIYAHKKSVVLTAADPSEFEFLPSRTITYTTVGEKVPVWIKVKYHNPLNAAQPVWIPAKVQCASANAFICNQGCDPGLPNGDCNSDSSAFVALAPGEYTLSAPAGGTRTVCAIGVDLDLAGVPDDTEECVGGFIRWNSDYDNGGDWPDYLYEGAIPAENDLMALILNPVEPAAALAPLDFVKLTWDSGAVKVYANPDRSGEISSGATVATSSLPRTFYVEGYGVSGLREVTFTLEYKTDDGRSFTDTVKATVLTVDTVFQCKTEKTEEDPGGFLALNDNDNAGEPLGGDPGNGVADNAETDPLELADPDLQQIVLGLSPVPDKGVTTLTYDSTKTRLWSTAKKEGLISPTGSWDLSVPAERDDFVANVAGTRCVEGYATGTGEVILAWESATDKVKITVVDIDIQFQGLPEERNATPPIPNEENPGGFLAVNENDDNSNGQPDKDDTPPLAIADPDLKPITFSMLADASSIPSVGTVTLSVPAHLKLWSTQQKNALIVGQFWDLSVPAQKSAFLAAVLDSGGQRWVEGIGQGEGYLSLSYDAAPECNDRVKITAIGVNFCNPVDVNHDGIVNDFAGADGGIGNAFTYTSSEPPAYRTSTIVVQVRISCGETVRTLLADKVTVHLSPVSNAAFTSVLTWDHVSPTDPSAGNLVYVGNDMWEATATFVGLPPIPVNSGGRVPDGIHNLLYGPRYGTVTVGNPYGSGVFCSRTAKYEMYFGENLVINRTKMAETTDNYTHYIQYLDAIPHGRETYEKMNCTTEIFAFYDLDKAKENYLFRAKAISLMAAINAVGPGSLDVNYFNFTVSPVIYPRCGQTYVDSTPVTHWQVGPHWSVKYPDYDGCTMFPQQTSVTASSAMANFLPFRGECFAATEICYLSGVLQVLGSARFDALHVSDLALGDPNDSGAFAKHLVGFQDVETFLPGDYLYMRNKADYKQWAPEGYWQGENCVCMGQNSSMEVTFAGMGESTRTEQALRIDLQVAYEGEPLTTDVNGNGVWDPGDSYTERNGNGYWDRGDCRPHVIADPATEIQFVQLCRILTGD